MLTTVEVEQIESWVKKEWKQYRVMYGVGASSIRVNSQIVCPCEDTKICPGRYDKIRYCKGCIREVGGKFNYMDVKGKTKEEIKALDAECTRHARCWCRDHNESYCDPTHRKPCLFCRYVPEPKPATDKKKTTKRTKAAEA